MDRRTWKNDTHGTFEKAFRGIRFLSTIVFSFYYCVRTDSLKTCFASRILLALMPKKYSRKPYRTLSPAVLLRIQNRVCRSVDVC